MQSISQASFCISFANIFHILAFLQIFYGNFFIKPNYEENFVIFQEPVVEDADKVEIPVRSDPKL